MVCFSRLIATTSFYSSKYMANISMGFIEVLPLSQGVNVIFVTVDILSKYRHFVGLKHLVQLCSFEVFKGSG